jgi:hypothetical protein
MLPAGNFVVHHRNLVRGLVFILAPARNRCFLSGLPQNTTSASALGATLGGILFVVISPELEQQVCAALVNLGALETEQGLHAEGVRTVQDVLQCSVADARAVLRDLRSRQRIEETTTSDEEVAGPGPHFRWARHAEPA